MKRLGRWLAGFVLLLLLTGAGALTFALGHRDLSAFDLYRQRPSNGDVTAVFLGTTSILLRDSSSAIMADGFVSRPAIWPALTGRIAPDTARIAAMLGRLTVDSLAAVLAGHTHYDHALDAPEIARRTGALLVGSSSLVNLGRGAGVPSSQLRVVRDGDTVRAGGFLLTFIASRHSGDDKFPGAIDAPFTPPAKASAWKTGTTWSVLVTHGTRTLLIHGSANYQPGALRGRHADVVFLGAAAVSKQSDAWVDAYWNEVVRATGARRVILVHWDDFFQNLDHPLVALPRAVDDVPASFRRLIKRATADSVEVLIPVAWQVSDPFAGLPSATP